MSPRVKLYLQLLDACDLAWDQLTEPERRELQVVVAKIPVDATGGPTCGNCGHRTNGPACGFCGSGTGSGFSESKAEGDKPAAVDTRFKLLELT